MKSRIYWRTLSPWLMASAALIAVPFIAAYMWIRHPQQCIQAWRETRRHY